VLPVLTKAGCNQGACHGALAGKNGFKLTLRGYDPELDYYALTREARGRRVSLAEPAASLILQKPSMDIPHGGGKRFAKDSLEYRVIGEWIAAGAPAADPKAPSVTDLEVYPSAAVLKPGAQQNLVVLAKYSDGRLQDVTRWAKFTSTDEGVASVDESGAVKMNGHGEAAITVWYDSKVLYSRLAVPFPHEVSQADLDRLPRKNFIDDHIATKLKSLNLAPSGQAPDEVFIRRAFLDAAGVLPTAEEVEEFLRDASPDKRSKLIERILDKDEFVDYWAYKWSDLMLVSSRKLAKPAMWSFYNWIRDSVKENRPWDQFARDIFTAAGSTRRNGALNYFVLHKDPIELSENVTKAFMGQTLTCARCHNHPMEKWTQRQYYEFTNLFARIGIKNATNPGEVIVYAKSTGDVNHPRLLRPLAPAPLDGESLDLDSPQDRRIAFANWLTDPENPFFAKNVVNRVWGNFMGRGFVEPLDDLRATNPASNEDLFNALAKDFAAHGYDVKHLIRTIMNSGAYQLSADSNATNQRDEKYYSRYIVKRLPAEVILDAISQVTGVPGQFPGYAPGIRAMQLPDVRVESQFLKVFGRPDRVICDVGERSSAPSISQALHVINGESLNGKLRNPNGYAALFLKLGLTDERILEHVYLSAFSRYPTETEKQSLLAALKQSRASGGTPEARLEARQHALEDMLWALLSSKEFLFNY
jgi:hypothetical protein